MRNNLPTLDYEIRVGYPKIDVAGCDEVGRGCIAGPVVAAAVVLPAQVDFEKDSWLVKIKDSKCLTLSVREDLVPKIEAWAGSWAIGMASVEEIDKYNIFHASHMAMVRAINILKRYPKHILVDGKFLPKVGLNAPATAVIQGDKKCLSIAAASILAKVWRDHLMIQLDQQFPVYGFAQHKGYPTPDHTLALKKNGISKMHRKSFKTCAMLN